MRMIPQPYQQQQGGSGIIIIDDAIHTAASNPAVASALPPEVGSKLSAVCAKPKSALVECEYGFMVAALQLARVWTQLP